LYSTPKVTVIFWHFSVFGIKI